MAGGKRKKGAINVSRRLGVARAARSVVVRMGKTLVGRKRKERGCPMALVREGTWEVAALDSLLCGCGISKAWAMEESKRRKRKKEWHRELRRAKEEVDTRPFDGGRNRVKKKRTACPRKAGTRREEGREAFVISREKGEAASIRTPCTVWRGSASPGKEEGGKKGKKFSPPSMKLPHRVLDYLEKKGHEARLGRGRKKGTPITKKGGVPGVVGKGRSHA